MSKSFPCLLIDKTESGQQVQFTERTIDDLPAGEVLVRVEYSTLNYKDALAITGKAPIARRFPLVPGIDFAGVVEASSDARFAAGERVILNGWGVGESHWGGLAGYARVRADWLVKLPPALSSRQAMAIGTAGYTAMLCVMALQQAGIQPDAGEIAVSGAAGGVGSVALMLLSRLGYQPAAITGRAAEADYLRSLGAVQIVPREELAAAGKPLQKERWAGAIDSAGSHVLANLCAQTKYRGAVAACGLAAGMDLPLTVAPFILRGVRLLGVDSVMCPTAERNEAWQRLAAEVDQSLLETMTQRVPLSQAPGLAPELLAGRVRGRVVVDVAR